MLHVARKSHLGFQVCDRCKKIICQPPDTPWPIGALISVLTPTDSNPGRLCKPLPYNYITISASASPKSQLPLVLKNNTSSDVPKLIL